MHFLNKLFTFSLMPFLFMSSVYAKDFTLNSTDIAHGDFMKKDQEFQGFGCDGGNQSPQLSWSGAPEGTKAYAILAYDPDAPTGSGWWHWQVINIQKSINKPETGVGKVDTKITTFWQSTNGK